MSRGRRAAIIIGLAAITGPLLLVIASESFGRGDRGLVDTGKMLEIAAIWVVGFALVVVAVLAWLLIDWAADDRSDEKGEN